MNYLSICAIVKDEGPYIREWLKVHAAQGVEHFYLFDNGSTDNTIQEIAAAEVPVTISYMPGERKQLEAYKDAILRFKEETRWMAFIDVDEFLYAKKFNTLHQLLSLYDRPMIAGLAVHWLLFGSNSYKEYSPEPVTKRFTRRAKKVNPHVKSIMNLSHGIGIGANTHQFDYPVNKHVVDECFNVLPHNYALHEKGTANIVACNHYCTKSYAECMERRSKPRPDTGEVRDAEEFFNAHDVNEVEDLFAWKLYDKACSNTNNSSNRPS